MSAPNIRARGVTLENVSRIFGGNTAVDSINLQVNPGEFVTLLGPSGCGKTTTLRMIAGLEPNDQGRVLIGDEVVSDPASGRYVPPERRELGMVFQSYAIWPHMSVFENVAYPLRVRGVAAAVVREKVQRALDLVEMGQYAQRPAPMLSGGQQQRVAIARALSFEPGILLLDEPLSNLDERLRLQMGREFRSLQQRLGITCLYVTHDQGEAMSLSDRIVLMHGGRILQSAAPEEIYQRPATEQVARFFGTPNLIDALVQGSRVRPDGTAMVAVAAAGWQGEARAAQALEAGAPVKLIARAEDIEVLPADAAVPADSVGWSVVVEASEFQGAMRRMVVAGDGLRLTVEAPAQRAARAGERAVAVVPHRCLWAVAA